jgi:hypothetical protein
VELGSLILESSYMNIPDTIQSVSFLLLCFILLCILI